MGWGLRPKSKKRLDEEAERERVKREVRTRDGNECCVRARRLQTGVRCSGPKDVHEIIPRSAWKAGYLVPDNCIVICRAHHDWVDHNPDDAHDLGLHGYSWERPS
jgi:hypothetical protein